MNQRRWVQAKLFAYDFFLKIIASSMKSNCSRFITVLMIVICSRCDLVRKCDEQNWKQLKECQNHINSWANLTIFLMASVIFFFSIQTICKHQTICQVLTSNYHLTADKQHYRSHIDAEWLKEAFIGLRWLANLPLFGDSNVLRCFFFVSPFQLQKYARWNELYGI